MMTNILNEFFFFRLNENPSDKHSFGRSYEFDMRMWTEMAHNMTEKREKNVLEEYKTDYNVDLALFCVCCFSKISQFVHGVFV